jgi:hypothetical protein
VCARDRVHLRLFVIAALAGSCGKPAAKESKPSPVATVSAPRLTSGAPFELVATSDGALLLWATGPCREGLQLQHFDANGVPRGSMQTLSACEPSHPDARITELVAVAGGGKLGVAWISEGAGGSEVLGSYGRDSGVTLAPTLPLGAAETSGPPHSRLWLSGAESGQLRLAYRAPKAACDAAPSGCALVVSQAHPPGSEAAQRGGGDTREVPFPCERLMVGSTWNRGIWYDAFCALDGAAGRATTEVYAIRPEIFYAEATPVLAGCTPLGLAPSQMGAVVFGRCGDELRVHVLRETQTRALIVRERRLQCDAGRPVLTLIGDHDERETFRLDAPRDRLELWIPPKIAPNESRVAFTGRRILIATVQANRLMLRTQHCEAQRLVSDPPTML